MKVPSGMGKSRIIIAAIALKHLYSNTKFFTVVFTSNLLKSADEDVFELAAAALGIDLKLVVYDPNSKLSGQVRENDYVVIDEADQILLDYGESLPHPRILALSATPFASSKAEEKVYLDEQRFKQIDSKMSGSIEWRTATERVDLRKFFWRTHGYARLIYCAG